MNTSGASDDLAFAQQMADAADAITRGAFVPGRSVDHRLKDDGTPVTTTDLAVEQELLALVRAHRPGDAFLGEEVGEHGTSHRCWVVDGVDGTTNFVKGRPLWGTLIALVEDGRPELGLNTSPGQHRRWWATRGGGAWTRSIVNPGTPSAATALRVATSPAVPPRANLELAWEAHPARPVVEPLVDKTASMAMTTHPALMVASGELDLAVQLAGGPWDFAAVMVIVQEAGGQCVDLSAATVERPRPPIMYLGPIEVEALQALLDE